MVVPWWAGPFGSVNGGDGVRSAAEKHFRGEPICFPDSRVPPPGGQWDLVQVVGTKSLLAVPLMKTGECLGFLNLAWLRSPHTFSNKEQHILQTLAHMLVSVGRSRYINSRGAGERSLPHSPHTHLDKFQSGLHHTCYAGQ
jgi:hypothetical protein